MGQMGCDLYQQKVKLRTTFVVVYLHIADHVPYSIDHTVQYSLKLK